MTLTDEERTQWNVKHKTSMMLSAMAQALLRGLAQDEGINQSAMLEILIRDRCKNNARLSREFWENLREGTSS